MAVRIADTLKQQNNLTTFPVAYGEDIWLDENKGSGTADYDSLQNLYNDGKLGGSSIQVETMPAASAENVGKIVQYVGETGSYEHGCFYECKDESGSYVWRYISTVKNGVFYTSDNIIDSTLYPVGSVAVYTGEPLWGLFKGHHYEYVEDTPLTTYKFNGTKNGETLSFFLANKKLEVGSALVRISDGYIVSYVSAINGTTITVQGRTYTETFTDVVETGETEEVASYTGWIDIGGGSDGGEEGTSIFYGTMDEWNALSTDAKKQYDYMSDNDEGDDKSATGVITRNTSNTSGMQEAYLKRIGKTVLLHCNLTDCVLPANEITTYATVQDGFRPDSSLQWAILDLDFTIEGLRGWITNSGNIQLLSPVATTSSIRIQSMYFTD